MSLVQDDSSWDHRFESERRFEVAERGLDIAVGERGVDVHEAPLFRVYGGGRAASVSTEYLVQPIGERLGVTAPPVVAREDSRFLPELRGQRPRSAMGQLPL